MELTRKMQMEEKIRKDYPNITGMTVLKDGEIVYENYFQGCTPDSRVHIYSVTKSIVSILLGIARDQGLIRNLDEKVLDFFPEFKASKRNKVIQDITLKNLLTMTAPYKRHIMPPYVKYFQSQDRVEFSLKELGGSGAVGKFQYAPLIGPDIFTGILTRVTGQAVLDYAQKNLFEPLNIQVEGSLVFQDKEQQLAFNKATDISGWAADAMGVQTAGWGLTLTAMDMAKLGQLYLDDGVWKEKQLVSEGWVRESTREHSRWKKQNLPYGYLWWIDENGFAAMGDGGNVIYVNRKKRLVVSVAALFKPGVTDRIEFIKEYIDRKTE